MSRDLWTYWEKEGRKVAYGCCKEAPRDLREDLAQEGFLDLLEYFKKTGGNEPGVLRRRLKCRIHDHWHYIVSPVYVPRTSRQMLAKRGEGVFQSVPDVVNTLEQEEQQGTEYLSPWPLVRRHCTLKQRMVLWGHYGRGTSWEKLAERRGTHPSTQWTNARKAVARIRKMEGLVS
jgi:hypothetical protein